MLGEEEVRLDAVSDIFDLLQLRGSFYFRTHFSGSWGTTVPALGHAARFHYAKQGSCWAKVEGCEPVRLNQGDLLMVPRGRSHILSNDVVQTAPPLETVMQEAGYDGNRVLSNGAADEAAATQLICGHFDFDGDLDHPLLDALPSYILITAEQRKGRPWLEEVLGLLVANVFNDYPGSLAAVTRLSEIIFIESLHCVDDEAPRLATLMKGFSDPRLARALAAMHREPERDWNVEALAREAGMSRTRFASEFQAAFDRGPFNYLTEWRMQRAAAALRRTDRRIADVAFANGYSNPAAFSRAFSARFGQTPRSMRKAARAGLLDDKPKGPIPKRGGIPTD